MAIEKPRPSPAEEPGIRLVVALGNPGKRYAQTRHNIGFMALDHWVASHGLRLRKAHLCEFGEFERRVSGAVGAASDRVAFVRPHTYMNLSGDAVGPVVRARRVVPQELLVIHDDLDIGLGRIQLKMGGSSAGHNGVQSLIDELGSDDFARLRLGIGRPPEWMDAADFVLRPFVDAEAPVAQAMIERAAGFIDLILSRGVALAMNTVNARATR